MAMSQTLSLSVEWDLATRDWLVSLLQGVEQCQGAHNLLRCNVYIMQNSVCVQKVPLKEAILFSSCLIQLVSNTKVNPLETTVSSACLQPR